jgi:hypothetical protein
MLIPLVVWTLFERLLSSKAAFRSAADPVLVATALTAASVALLICAELP